MFLMLLKSYVARAMRSVRGWSYHSRYDFSA
jgi:hypothetical protein